MAKLWCLFLVTVLAVVVAVSADGCDNDRQAMLKQCSKYQKWPAEPKLDPSEACCAVWHKADIPCLCAGMEKEKTWCMEKEKTWCMEKVAYVAKFCNRPFQPGYKCGSYTFPPQEQ